MTGQHDFIEMLTSVMEGLDIQYMLDNLLFRCHKYLLEEVKFHLDHSNFL